MRDFEIFAELRSIAGCLEGKRVSKMMIRDSFKLLTLLLSYSGSRCETLGSEWSSEVDPNQKPPGEARLGKGMGEDSQEEHKKSRARRSSYFYQGKSRVIEGGRR